jgi:hypothetical protein
MTHQASDGTGINLTLRVEIPNVARSTMLMKTILTLGKAVFGDC